MTLDLSKIGAQIGAMGRRLRDSREARGAQLGRARDWFHEVAPRWESLAEQFRGSQTSMAIPCESLDADHALPLVPKTYEVLATDGSSIPPDRHGPAMCAVINIGCVAIRYGDAPMASLESQAQLLSEPESLYVLQGGRKVLVSERLLDTKRSVAEMEALSELTAASDSGDIAQVALADGLLTVWRQDWAADDIPELTNDFRHALDRIAEGGVPLAAYISEPHSHWVVDVLRSAARCSGGPKACSARCGEDGCALDGVLDVDLYRHYLAPDHRSGLFKVVGRDADRYGEQHRVHLFYLNIGQEIARIEIPTWVAEDNAAVDLIHAIIWDQAQRGQGYPVALARAHETAVISGQDRWAFRQLVIEALAREGLPTGLSEKQSSKDLRAV